MRRLALSGLAFLAAALAFAAAPDPATLMTVEASVAPAAEAGQGTLTIRARLAEGWHVNSHKPSEDYLIATEVALAPTPGVTFGEPVYPEGKMEKFAFAETPLSVYAGEFPILVPVRWGTGAAPALAGTINYQACNDKQCLAPASVKFATAGAPASAAAPAAGPLSGGAVPLSEARRVQAGSGSSDLGSVAREARPLHRAPLDLPRRPRPQPDALRLPRHSPDGRLLLRARPAVRRRRAFGLSALYVLGMATTYSALGVAAALSGKLFGSLLQNPFVLAGDRRRARR